MQLKKTYRAGFLGMTFLLVLYVNAQNAIPARSVIKNSELYNYLKPSTSASLKLEDITLAQYFREQFSKNYFYDWKTNDERFAIYQKLYKNQKHHKGRSDDHRAKFKATTPWQLPFNYQNGEKVSAYALRHLARQHKMVDVAMMYRFDDKNEEYINYFTEQMRSLNAAVEANKYETIKSGNGVFEVFRSGYRVLNWLEIHSLFLGEEAYSDEDQLTTIATLLQHGQHLYELNQKFRKGNHQTKGMSSLAMLAILFKDFEGTDKWYETAMTRLGEHLDKEINDDGFQFERTVHYHMSDIANYFYPYQLAKLNKMPVGEEWESKLNSLFTTLVKIAYPDKTAPVLSDDTDQPWAERNEIAGSMTLGYLLFENAEFGYFAKNKVSSKMYWFITNEQLELLKDVDTKKPTYGSLYFPDTKYYVMREGYDKGDNMMVISAGLDPDKPDHQHGDMLGIQASANGNIILPNYQVRYSLPDYGFFKNSLVKNVALVDDQMLGKEYKGNKGGSGFGKFKLLPNPTTLAWETNDTFDFYAGSHDGFEAAGVNYTRQVIYVKDGFWIVKDNFTSDATHTYKQVWQGHYTPEGTPNLLRSSFEDATGADIYQLNSVDTSTSDGAHGKQWNVVSKEGEKDFEFVTVIYPYSGYDKGVNISKGQVGGYTINKLPFEAKGDNLKSLSKGNEAYLFGVNTLKMKSTEIQFDFPLDCHLTLFNDKIVIYSLNAKENAITINEKAVKLLPGDQITIDTK